MSLLSDRWYELASAYCSDGSLIRSLFQSLWASYSEPHRFYHNAAHLEKLLHWSGEYAGNLQDRNLVDFSIYYHDIVYQPGRGNNEQQSARVAEIALRRLGVDAHTISGVTSFILATRTHRLPPGASSDLKYFSDFDMGILAAERKEYEAYSCNIRKEFGPIGSAQYVPGRTAFLQSLLQQPHIFYTDAFRALEPQARENLLWEIEHLRHI